MSETADQIQAFADALEAGESEAARDLALSIAESIDDRTAEEIPQVHQSLIGRAAAGEDEMLILDRHALSSIGVTLTDASVLLASVAAIENPAGPDSELIDEIRTLADTHEKRTSELARARSEAEARTSGLPLPPNIVISAVRSEARVIPAKQPMSVELLVANAGAAPAEGVAVEVTALEGLSVSPETRELGTIAAERTESGAFEVTGSQPGEGSVSFTVESLNAGSDSRELRISVREIVSPDSDDTTVDLPGIGWIGGAIGAGVITALLLKGRLEERQD